MQNIKHPMAVVGAIGQGTTVGSFNLSNTSDKDLLKRMKKTAVYHGKTIKTNKL